MTSCWVVYTNSTTLRSDDPYLLSGFGRFLLNNVHQLFGYRPLASSAAVQRSVGHGGSADSSSTALSVEDDPTRKSTDSAARQGRQRWLAGLAMSFDCEVRERGCRIMMRTSESRH